MIGSDDGQAGGGVGRAYSCFDLVSVLSAGAPGPQGLERNVTSELIQVGPRVHKPWPWLQQAGLAESVGHRAPHLADLLPLLGLEFSHDTLLGLLIGCGLSGSHRKRDAMLHTVDFLDADLHLLADGDDLAGIVDPFFTR